MTGARVSFVVAILAALHGCKSGDPPTSSPLISVQVTPTPVVLKPGQTVQLFATVLGPPGIDQAVRWKSLDTLIASVTDRGLVTAIAVGATSIRATWITDTDEFGSSEIQVTESPIGPDGIRVQGAGGRKVSRQGAN